MTIHYTYIYILVNRILSSLHNTFIRNLFPSMKWINFVTNPINYPFSCLLPFRCKNKKTCKKSAVYRATLPVAGKREKMCHVTNLNIIIINIIWKFTFSFMTLKCSFYSQFYYRLSRKCTAGDRIKLAALIRFTFLLERITVSDRLHYYSTLKKEHISFPRLCIHWHVTCTYFVGR